MDDESIPAKFISLIKNKTILERYTFSYLGNKKRVIMLKHIALLMDLSMLLKELGLLNTLSFYNLRLKNL